MAKGTLEFNLPEEQEEFKTAQNGVLYKIALDEIWQQLFRPYYKHGYADDKLNKALESKDGDYIITTLREMYLQIREETFDGDED